MTTVRTVALLLLFAAAAAASSCDRGPPAEPPGLAASETLLASGRWGEALRELRKVPLADLPGAAARLRAARVAADSRDFALAARILEPDGRVRGRSSGPARMLRAEALLRSGDLEGSREALAALERDGFRDERWRFLYALHCLARGERDLGSRNLGELVQEGSRDPEVLSRWAEVDPYNVMQARRLLSEALGKAADRGPLLSALGACLLMGDPMPDVALVHLGEAVRLRPFDRDARVNLARALRSGGSRAMAARAAEEASRVLEQDPDDADARLLLAEILGEKGRLSIPPDAAAPGAEALKEWDRAEKEYAELLRRGVRDPATAIRALQGWARIHVEEIPLDPPGQAMGPGSHYARAAELLDRALALDPEGRLGGGPYRSRLLAETLYLRGRAARKAHTGSSDHTEALGWLRRAFDADHRHLDASWDLGLLCHDFFPDSKEYRDLAASVLRVHVDMRNQLGVPALDPERMAIVEACMKAAGTRLLPGPPEDLPPPPPPPPPPPK